MNSIQEFITDYARLLDSARRLPLGGLPKPAPFVPNPKAPRALIFSPHPDDEVIIGGLALRLLRELRWNVLNVAVTLGSQVPRRSERLTELRACCDYIGFGLIETAPGGLEGINVQTRITQPAAWEKSVSRVAEILSEQQPRAIFFPHEDDWNSTHIGTHHLVADALARLGKDFSCLTVETEFWGAMDDPNLMVESTPEEVTDLISALTFHVGEVRRNPYHLRTPAWMMDNVRRGCELVGGQGGASPDFLFGTLYRLRRWSEGKFQPVLTKGTFLSHQDELRPLFGELESA